MGGTAALPNAVTQSVAATGEISELRRLRVRDLRQPRRSCGPQLRPAEPSGMRQALNTVAAHAANSKAGSKWIPRDAPCLAGCFSASRPLIGRSAGCNLSTPKVDRAGPQSRRVHQDDLAISVLRPCPISGSENGKADAARAPAETRRGSRRATGSKKRSSWRSGGWKVPMVSFQGRHGCDPKSLPPWPMTGGVESSLKVNWLRRYKIIQSGDVSIRAA